MNAIPVLVNGAQGRMGQEAVKAITAESGLELVAQTDLGDDLPAMLRNSGAQVAVDFTTATVAYNNARTLIECGVRPVIGTSGLLPEQVAELQALCQAKQIGGVIAPNFAIGAVLMMKYAADAVKYFPHVEVIELHHDRKADAPSGTAVKTASLLAEARTETRSTEARSTETRTKTHRRTDTRNTGYAAATRTIWQEGYDDPNAHTKNACSITYGDGRPTRTRTTATDAG